MSLKEQYVEFLKMRTAADESYEPIHARLVHIQTRIDTLEQVDVWAEWRGIDFKDARIKLTLVDSDDGSMVREYFVPVELLDADNIAIDKWIAQQKEDRDAQDRADQLRMIELSKAQTEKQDRALLAKLIAKYGVPTT
jgi:hypothetical protein